MTDDNGSPKEDQLLALSAEQVRTALTGLGHDTPCPTCSGDNYNLATANGSPCIINGPLVSHEGMAMWFFALVCKTCGSSRMIDAFAVLQHAAKKQADE